MGTFDFIIFHNKWGNARCGGNWKPKPQYSLPPTMSPTDAPVTKTAMPTPAPVDATPAPVSKTSMPSSMPTLMPTDKPTAEKDDSKKACRFYEDDKATRTSGASSTTANASSMGNVRRFTKRR